MKGVRKSDRALRIEASSFESAWRARNPQTHHEAMLAARELRPLSERLRGNPYLKTPERLWDEEVVRQTWVMLNARWPRGE